MIDPDASPIIEIINPPKGPKIAILATVIIMLGTSPKMAIIILIIILIKKAIWMLLAMKSINKFEISINILSIFNYTIKIKKEC